MQAKILPKKLALSTILLLLTALFACKNESKCKDCSSCGENLEYGIAQKILSSSDTKVTTKLDTMVEVDQQFVENKIKIEEKFGEQWDFCRCVLANDSLDRLIKNNAELDDKFMEVFDEVDQKCKAFLVMSPNKTPKERIAHERKTKKCLKAAGRK